MTNALLFLIFLMQMYTNLINYNIYLWCYPFYIGQVDMKSFTAQVISGINRILNPMFWVRLSIGNQVKLQRVHVSLVYFII